MAGDVQTALQDFGGAVTDLFGASGATASASSYQTAATIAAQNAQIAKQATDIKETQISRLLFKTIGTQSAAIGGAGFAASGSALDIMRASASEGAMAKAIAREQGAITENSYAEQAGLYKGLADSAKTAGTGNVVGGIIQGAGGAISAAKAVSGLFNAAPIAADFIPGVGAVSSDIVGGVVSGMDLVEGGTATAAALGLDAGVAVGGEAVAAGAGEALAVGAGEVAAVGAGEAAAGIGLEEVATAAVLWVICTELRHQGKLADAAYRASAPRFIELPQDTKAGYHWWALPYVRLMRHPRYGALATALIRPLAQERVDYLNGRFNVLGWLSVVAGEPVCNLIGKLINRRGFCAEHS